MEDEVWIQLYVGQEKCGRVFPLQIASLSKTRINELANAVHKKRGKSLGHCDEEDLVVYKAGAEFPPKEEAGLGPSKPVPEGTKDENPLRVVAPAKIVNEQEEPLLFFTFKDCIYILCSNEENVIQPIATAFAVNGKFALTAAHTVAKQGPMGVEFYYRNLCLTAHLDRKGNQAVPKGELIAVKVENVDLTHDWAVLKRQDDEFFKDTLPVATLDKDIPTDGTKNTMTFYHCPVTLFQTQGAPALHVTPKEGSVGLIGTETIQFHSGGFDGSCGGPYVFRGKAVAMHVESVNSALTYEALKAHQRAIGERKDDRMRVGDAIALAESNSSAHTSNASGIILRAHPELMKYINGTYM